MRADELPASFKGIPPASDIGGLRSSVAGTEEAEDAIVDAAIPQTTAIKRSEATLTVEYDGEPKFEKIEGTSVSYAVNTGAQVLSIDGRYYAVDQGVWFTSKSAKGPWEVADSIPDQEIGKIPPSSPVYNTTYVNVYESTPEVVYVGYTPGYMWSFPYYGVPVYGTGWYYPPYWGRYYYPRPPTWGFNVGYNPWTGWNFGVSWSNGFFSFGMSWGGGWGGNYRPWGCCGGWYGGGYRGPTIINTGDINIGNSVSIGNRNKVSRNLDLDNSRTHRNIYNRQENRARNADKALARSELKRARPANQRANDVFADRSGAARRLRLGAARRRQVAGGQGRRGPRQNCPGPRQGRDHDAAAERAGQGAGRAETPRGPQAADRPPRPEPILRGSAAGDSAGDEPSRGAERQATLNRCHVRTNGLFICRRGTSR